MFGSAQPQTGGYRHRLALTTDGYEVDIGVGGKLVIHEVGLAVGQPDHMGDFVLLKLRQDGCRMQDCLLHSAFLSQKGGY